MMDKHVTRFAPSPTGLLHLGHARSALAGWRAAQHSDGRFLLRIEDIDLGRCRQEFVDAIYEDLAWLGVSWEQPVRRQSQHLSDYRAALDQLEQRGLIYSCFCTRADIAAASSAPHGPEGAIYPGTCRHLGSDERARRIASGQAYAVRLDVGKAFALTGPLTWHDAVAGEVAADPLSLGDVVLARKDVPTSYHLAVTVDDHLQGVTLVTRGVDLFHATHIHRLLQALLGYATPAYQHHELIVDSAGRRLAKRDQSMTLRALREAGFGAAEIQAMALTERVT